MEMLVLQIKNSKEKLDMALAISGNLFGSSGRFSNWS